MHVKVLISACLQESWLPLLHELLMHSLIWVHTVQLFRNNFRFPYNCILKETGYIHSFQSTVESQNPVFPPSIIAIPFSTRTLQLFFFSPSVASFLWLAETRSTLIKNYTLHPPANEPTTRSAAGEAPGPADTGRLWPAERRERGRGAAPRAAGRTYPA